MKYIVSATETSSIQDNSPTYDQIYSALVRRSGTWIGPGPRVTRPSGDYFRTTFAWPIEIGTVREIEPLRVAIQNALAQIRNSAFAGADWSPVTIEPYIESVNGPLADWVSGAAIGTQTRNAPVGVVIEDPVKPGAVLSGEKPPTPKPSDAGLWLGLGAVALVGALVIGSKGRRPNPIGRRPRKASDDSWILPVLIAIPFVPPF